MVNNIIVLRAKYTEAVLIYISKFKYSRTRGRIMPLSFLHFTIEAV